MNCRITSCNVSVVITEARCKPHGIRETLENRLTIILQMQNENPHSHHYGKLSHCLGTTLLRITSPFYSSTITAKQCVTFISLLYNCLIWIYRVGGAAATQESAVSVLLIHVEITFYLMTFLFILQTRGILILFKLLYKRSLFLLPD